MEREIKYGVQKKHHDDVPMQELETELMGDENKNHNSEDTFCSEIMNSRTVRSQVVRSICISSADTITGWMKAQIGPAFPDIMLISGTDLTKGSTFMTAWYAGQLLGAFLASMIFSRISKYLVFSISMILSGFTLAAIPWCFLYELMITAFAFIGIYGGIICVGISSELVAIWGPTARGRSYLMINSVGYSTAGVIAPLVTAPFLLNQPEKHVTNTASNTTFDLPILLPNQTTQPGLGYMNPPVGNSLTVRSESSIYKAFIISAVLYVSVAVVFVMLFCQQGKDDRRKAIGDKVKFIGNHSLLMKRLQLVNIGVFSMVENALDFTLAGYMVTFCMRYLRWTATAGATLTSILFIARVLGIFSGIFLVRYVKSHQIIFVSTILITVSFICLTVSAHFYVDIGIWIFVCTIGIPFGFLWPNFLTWVNANLIPVRDVIASYLILTSYTGALLAPLLLGYMMEEVSLIWFCYLFTLKSIIMFVNASFMFYFTVSQHTAKQ